MKRILIIQDNPVEASIIERRLHRAVLCECTSAVASNSTELMEIIRNHLAGSGCFSATILDLIFPGERSGGVTVWRSLSEDERKLCGTLIIVSKDAPSGEVKDFIEEFAEHTYIQSYVEDVMVSRFREILDSQPAFEEVVTRDINMLRSAIHSLEKRIVHMEQRFKDF